MGFFYILLGRSRSFFHYTPRHLGQGRDNTDISHMEEGRTQACELENEEEGRLLEDLLLWAASIGITDSPPYSSPIGCLGDSIHLAQFPDAGGWGEI